VAVPVLISIVDDDPSVREALCRLLRTVGFEVSAFASGEEYLSSDQLKNPDCHIVDVRMPGMSGIELRRQLVASHADIPVIFITAHEDESIRAQALNGHASAILKKPFSEEALLNAINKVNCIVIAK
jgi:FixJ family two-component response regulator